MKLTLKALLLSLFVSSVCLAGAPKPIRETVLEDFSKVYEAMIQKQGFKNGQGHTIAASIVSSCPTIDNQLTPERKASFLRLFVEALGKSNMTIITTTFPVNRQRQRVISTEYAVPEVSAIAAILLCKMGKDSVGDTVKRLDKAYDQLRATDKIDALWNVFSTANLME